MRPMSIDASFGRSPVCAAYLSGMASGMNEATRSYAVATNRATPVVDLLALPARRQPAERKDGRITSVMRGNPNTCLKAPARKEAGPLQRTSRRWLAFFPLTNIKAVRNRALLLIGFAGGLRRSEIVGSILGPCNRHL